MKSSFLFRTIHLHTVEMSFGFTMFESSKVSFAFFNLTRVGRRRWALDPCKMVEGAGAGGGAPRGNAFAVILHHLQCDVIDGRSSGNTFAAILHNLPVCI